MRAQNGFIPRVHCLLLVLAVLLVACGNGDDRPADLDLLLTGGTLFDGSSSEPILADIGVRNGRIAFVGDAGAAGIRAAATLDVAGRWVTPGFIDMHSHAELDKDYGRDAAPYLYQGITTVVLGADGDSPLDIAQQLADWEANGIGVNALTYIGHGDVRAAVMGREDRAPSDAELSAMRALVRQGMDDGAFGLSTGLFYVPGTYASTEEVIELAKVAAAYPGAIYDTHDRDLGAVYEGIGYDASVREGIRIAEEAGIRAIFSHFNLQGAHNNGRADVGAKLINDARRRGVDVWAAQHPYTATQSSLRSYTVPSWAAAGGHAAMVERFDDPEQAERIVAAIESMLEIRGGAEKILLVDERPGLNGKTLAQYAKERELGVTDTVLAILREGNVTVMNLELYDHANTRRLATEDWMMTCTDGRTPAPEQAIAHPRTFGAFPMKYRLFVRDEPLLSPQFVVRSFSGLAADFLGLPDRGYLRPGMAADIVVLDPDRYTDTASYDDPQQFATGVEQVLVNGRFAIRDSAITSLRAGKPLKPTRKPH
jgi:N-acyl-D-amino-acid deacylase